MKENDSGTVVKNARFCDSFCDPSQFLNHSLSTAFLAPLLHDMQILMGKHSYEAVKAISEVFSKDQSVVRSKKAQQLYQVDCWWPINLLKNFLVGSALGN